MSKQTQKNQINLVEIFFYLLRHWYWFVICAGIAVAYAYYKYTQMPFVYRADATIIIKDPSHAQSTVSLERYASLINNVDVTNEILQLSSKQLMAEVVKTLDADVTYSYKEKLREVELYRRTPVRLFFSREDNSFLNFAAKIIPVDQKTIRVDRTEFGGDSQIVALGDTVTYDNHKLVFMPTSAYSPYYYGKEIVLRKVPSYTAAAGYVSRLSVSQTNREGTILHLFIQDYSVQRACDILNALIDKYNEETIREKNRIAVNTATFINERLMIIQQELGDVEENLATFRSNLKTMSVDAAAQEYLSASRTYNTEIIQIETRLSLAEYLRDFLSSSFSTYEMIPLNIGLDEKNIDSEIAQYNELILRREKLVEASSPESPAVRQVEVQLNSLRQNMLGYIDNLVNSMNVQKRELADKEHEAIQNFTAMPAKARQMLSIERKQKIKESLFIFLMNKREENALTQAMVDNNARLLDAAEGSGPI